MDDLKNLPEPSRSRAKALLTCRLCSQYFVDPRVLPCRHSFCRKCLQSLHDSLQAAAQPSSLRIGSMPCPTCQQPIGIPMTGMRGFPVDTKISRIKDLVVNEMAKNISKKINGSSDADSPKSENAADDDSYSTRSAEDAAASGPNGKHRRDHSYDNMSFSDRVGTGANYKPNPAYPDFSKFAKYFDHDGKPVEPAPFKPTIRADRHRVGYSSSFQHQRRKPVTVRVRAMDDSIDLFPGQSSRYGSAPHVGEDGQVPTRDGASVGGTRPNSSAYQRSRSARPATSRTFDSPVNFDDDDFSPEPSKTAEKGKTDPPLLHRTRATTDSNGSKSFDADTPSPKKGESGRTGPKPRRGLRADGASKADRSHGGAGTLPVHRENITTETSGTHRYFGAANPSESAPGFSYSRPNSSGTYNNKADDKGRSPAAHNVHFNDEKQAAGSGRKLPKTPMDQKDVPFGGSDKKGENVRSSYKQSSPEPSSARRTSSSRMNEDGKKTNRDTSGGRLRKGSDVTTDEKPGSTSSSSYRTTRTQGGSGPDSDSMRKQSKPVFDTPKKPMAGANEGSGQETKSSMPRRPSSGRRLPDDVSKQAESEGKANVESPKRPRSVGTAANGEQSKDPFSRRPNDSASAKKENGNKQFSSSSGQEEAAESSKRERNNRSARLNNKANGSTKQRKDIPHGNQFEFMTAPMNEDGTPWGTGRTKEQRRQDARRHFSDRIKHQFEVYMKNKEQEPTEANQKGEEAGGQAQTDSSTEGQTTGQEPGTAGTEQANDTKNNVQNGKKVSSEPAPEPEKPGRNWEELINNTRAKYSSERVEKSMPVGLEPLCAEGVFSKWRISKTEFGIPTSMAISSKGCVVVAEYGQNCLEFYDEAGAPAHNMEGVKPFSVVFNDKDQVIVGDRRGQAVRIFDEYGGDVAHWDATSFKWICGIAVLENGHLAIYDRERCKIGIYSSPGEKVREFSSFGLNDSQVCMADFIAIDSKSRILIADSGNHCVKIFDSMTGAHLGKFGARGDADGCLDWPKGICVDANDNIIVTDVYNSRVSMFSPSGQFMHHLITDIENPYSICYSKPTSSIGLTRYDLDGTSQYDVYGV